MGDRALDQRYIDILRKFLDIGNWTVDQVGPLRQVNQALIKVEKTHVTAGTTTQPGGGETNLV
jgi:hypothetical protein